MVWLQAMVLGRLGRKPSPHPRACALSCPSPFAGRGSTGFRPLFIMLVLLAASFFTHPPTTRPSLFALEALRWVLGVETMTNPGGSRTPRKALQLPPCSAHRLLSWVGAPTSGPSLRPDPMPQEVSYVHHADLYIRNLIPDGMIIPSSASLVYRSGAM
jgi:hypothetical protein